MMVSFGRKMISTKSSKPSFSVFYGLFGSAISKCAFEIVLSFFFSFFFRLHRELVRGFLGNAIDMVKKNGEIHITHKTAHPFNKLEVAELAEEIGACSRTTKPEFFFDGLKYK